MTQDSNSDKLEPKHLAELRRVLNELQASLPENYTDQRTALLQVTDVVRENIRDALEPAFNARAQELPQTTYDEKKKLAKWANAELRQFGLAIRDPKTGNRCFLMANPGGRPGFGRYLFEYTDEQGKRRHPFTSTILPKLELILDDLSRTPYGTRSSKGR